jgi:hypothetical protein
MPKDTPENPQDAEESAPAVRENFVARSRSGSFESDADLKGRLPKDILKNYECHQWKHAAAILANELQIVEVLREMKNSHERYGECAQPLDRSTVGAVINLRPEP